MLNTILFVLLSSVRQFSGQITINRQTDKDDCFYNLNIMTFHFSNGHIISLIMAILNIVTWENGLFYVCVMALSYINTIMVMEVIF